MKRFAKYLPVAALTLIMIVGYLAAIRSLDNQAPEQDVVEVTVADITDSLRETINDPSASSAQCIRTLDKLVEAYQIEIETAETAHAADRSKLILISILSFLAAVVMVLAVMLRLRNHNNDVEARMDANMIAVDSLRDELKSAQNELTDVSNRHAELKGEIRRLLASEFKTIDRLSDVYFQFSGTQREKSKIYEEVIQQIQSIGSSEKWASEIEKRVDSLTGGLVERLRSELPSLKEWEVRLFLLNILGFSPRAISIFQNTTLRVTYGRKAALKRKIKAAATKSMAEFIEILD